MTITDQELQAYVDGELAPDDAARVEAAMAGDVLLAARVEREKRLRDTLRRAYAPVLGEPVPARLHAVLDAPAARANAGVTDIADRRRPRPRWRAPVLAIAASIAAIAMALWLRAPGGDVASRGADLVARGELERGLDRALASVPDAEANVRIGLTFRDASGRVCRTFATRATSMAGLACRDGQDWSLQVLSRVDAGEAGALRQASSGMTPEIQAAVDARMQGEAFDAEQERDALARGWR